MYSSSSRGLSIAFMPLLPSYILIPSYPSLSHTPSFHHTLLPHTLLTSYPLRPSYPSFHYTLLHPYPSFPHTPPFLIPLLPTYPFLPSYILIPSYPSLSHTPSLPHTPPYLIPLLPPYPSFPPTPPSPIPLLPSYPSFPHTPPSLLFLTRCPSCRILPLFIMFLVGLASLQAKRFSGITYQYTIEILVVVDKTPVSHAYYVVTCHAITVMPLANSLMSGPLNILQYCPPSRHSTARMWHVFFFFLF